MGANFKGANFAILGGRQQKSLFHWGYPEILKTETHRGSYKLKLIYHQTFGYKMEEMMQAIFLMKVPNFR